ncbi:hypothetical protein M407DRAFT_5731 [Tulasnella calospora MUT 4182]|uniref:Uncharacterized protein n=1 Tax=Tulasnella calospora MUT 4182 TaxID=1051891 RepID=A0A0C3M908_9AGAM|nr:hypothetical protein M407DRAFT_5731 [Tulasnella calospora MUT 4182]
MQIPPLQWLNLSKLYNGGSQPVPLRDAHVAYDPAKRVLVIFGGESSAGVPTQQTYILELDTLTWRYPDPPAAQQDIPPARSRGVFGQDIASNYRAGMLVWGGKGGSGNTPLDDLWYYHYQNEFWAKINVTGDPKPIGRWGAAGGTAPASSIQNVETFMWMAGGTNQTDAFGFDQVWQLDVTGVIAAGSVAASAAWSKVPTSASDKDQPNAARYGLAGTVLPPIGNTDRKGTLVVFGGCDPNSAGVYNATCAQNTANILTLPTDSSQTAAQWTMAASCLPGSYGATMAPNRNQAASVFSSQAFLFPGSVDSKEWTDTSGTQQGEVAILLASSGVWARVLPAGDPSSDPPRPSFKEGSTVYSNSGSITGNNGAWSDTIVFGGRDVVTGELTNELWLLRAYNGTIQSSADHWSGYGDGNLDTGLAADGSGVTVEYLSQCATPTDTANPTPTTGDGSNSTNGPSPQSRYSETILDGSPVHKILSPLSIGLLLPAILLYRASSGPILKPIASSASIAFASSGGIFATAAYVLGIVGFALGVSRSNDDSTTTALQRRAESVATRSPFLTTSHSKAALILFVVLYGILPLLAAALYLTKRRDPKEPKRPELEHGRKTTDETVTKTLVGSGPGEKGTARSSEDELGRRRLSVESQAVGETEEGLEMAPRPRSLTHSGLYSTLNAGTAKSRRKSTATLHSSSPPSAYTPPKFEVVNRPNRASTGNQGPAYSHIPRNPSDLSWLERRRSVGLYGQLDYQLSQNGRSVPTFPPAPSSAHEMSPTTPPVPALTPPRLPSRTSQMWFNVALQVVVLWASVFWLVTFAIMGSIPGLALVAVVTIAYYVMLVTLAWLNRPQHSILVVVISRLRGDPADASTPAASSELPSTPLPPISPPPHPYLNSPPWRVTQSHADDDLLSRARSMDSEAPEDDEDDDERQARIEEEMARRDVSIFTVPKRRLVVRNVVLD